MLVPRTFTRNNFFNDFFNDDFFTAPLAKKETLMKTDIKKEDGVYKLGMELPGYNKEDISAELNDGTLTIKAETKNEVDEKDKEGNYIHRERYYGSCQRSFYVGEGVTEEDIKAKFENGVLSLEIPAVKEQKKVEQKKLIAIE